MLEIPAPYGLHPSFAMEASYRAKLKEKTGHTVEEWIQIVRRDGPKTERERREWLRAFYHVPTNYAWWIAERAEGRVKAATYDPIALVDQMFSGKRAALRPIYERVLEMGCALGSDVKACPGKTIVPLYRKHVFAEIRPATLSRLDVGLALKDTPCSGRLQETGGLAKKDRITHRLQLHNVGEVDDEVKSWLEAAYVMDA